MAWTHEVWKYCPRCKGEKVVPSNQPPDEGEYQEETIECPRCNGEGGFLWGRLKNIGQQ